MRGVATLRGSGINGNFIRVNSIVDLILLIVATLRGSGINGNKRDYNWSVDLNSRTQSLPFGVVELMETNSRD